MKKTIGMILVLMLFVTGCQTNVASTNTKENKDEIAIDTETIIVGGGISGLTSAYYLDKENHDFVLLEKENVVGGKAIGGLKDGFYYAKGTEYIGEPEGALKVMIKGLDIDLTEIPNPMDIHIADGKKYYGSAGLILHFIEKSSVEEFNRFIKEIFKVYDEYDEIPYFDKDFEIARLDNITAAKWFEEQEFSEVYYNVYNVSCKGIFGATLDEVSALNMIPEIAFDFVEGMTIEKEDIEQLKKMNVPFKNKGGSMAYTFKEGIAELPLSIYSKLEEHIQLSSCVKKIEKKNDIYYVTYEDTIKNEINVLTAKNVIIAVPAPIASWLSKDLLTKKQSITLNKIPYASYITAALYTDEYIVNEAFDIAITDKCFFTDIYDSTWVQRAYDKTIENKKNSILSLYIAPESYKSEVLKKMSDEVVLNNIYAELKKLKGFENIEEHVTGYDIYNIEYAYPVMIPGAYRRIQELHDELNGNLQLAGDYMIFPTLEGAVESGAIAAKKIIDIN